MLDHSPTFVTRTLPSGCPRTDPVELSSGVQAGSESGAAPLVYADARNVEVLTDLQPVNAGRDLAVIAPVARPVDGRRRAAARCTAG